MFVYSRLFSKGLRDCADLGDNSHESLTPSRRYILVESRARRGDCNAKCCEENAHRREGAALGKAAVKKMHTGGEGGRFRKGHRRKHTQTRTLKTGKALRSREQHT